MCVYPDQVAVECLKFGMFPAINFALPPSWAKADFAGYIGRRALPLGVALPARSPADLTQTQRGGGRESQQPASQAITGQTGQTRGGGTHPSVPACLASLPNLPGPAGTPLFLPTFRPPTPRLRLCPQHNNITDQRQLVNSLLSRPATQQIQPPSLSPSTPPDFLLFHPSLLNLSVNKSDKMANEVRVVLL